MAGKKYRGHRAPHTTPERRINGRRSFLDVEEYRIRLRPKRNMANLPEAWDDMMRSDVLHRSWKRHRKTQYKPC